MKEAGLSCAHEETCASASPLEIWQRFARLRWEKTPVTLERCPAVPRFPPEEAFQASVRASNAFRAGDNDVRIYFYIDHTQVVADVEKHLPKANDQTAANYAQRIRRNLKGRRFALILQEVQAHHASLWLRLRKFQREFEQGSGISGHGAKATLFLGDYEATPFGVHRGNSNVFKFMIAGRKRIRLWPDHFVHTRGVPQHSLESERLGAPHFSLEGGPGDLLYWPADFWHVGECLEGLTISLSLALFPQRVSVEEDLAECAIRSVVKRGDRPGRRQGSFDRKILAHPIFSTLQRAINQPEVHESLKVLWLNRASSSGFRAVPQPEPHKALADDTWVQSLSPILCVRGNRHEIFCSANGHAFAVTAHPRILKLLANLNEGKPYRVGTLVERYAGRNNVDGIKFAATPGEIRLVLEKLCSLRAIAASPAENVSAGIPLRA